MTYLETDMAEQQHDWPTITGLLGFLLALVIAFTSWVRSSFRDKSEARDKQYEKEKEVREAEIIRQEKERSETITRAVQVGLESFNKEIRQEFKQHKEDTAKQFDKVNSRIDEIFTKLN